VALVLLFRIECSMIYDDEYDDDDYDAARSIDRARTTGPGPGRVPFAARLSFINAHS